MGIQKIILNFILRIELGLLSVKKIKKNRITFISLETDHLTSDFQFIYNELDKELYDIKLCLIHYNKNLWGQFLYFLNCLKQLYLVNTSKIVIINDNNYVVSHFKRKEVTVLQVWHACGAIKKFGNVIPREYPIANYDYVLSTSSYWKKPYSEAFSVPVDHVLPYGMPRNDELFTKEWIAEKKTQFYQKYPCLKNKKVILYAPTFRGDIYKGFEAIPFPGQQLIEALGEDYVLMYKYHPLLGNIQLESHSQIKNMNKEDTHELFCICDYLISDYSSIIFDYMILKKPLLFYTPDLVDYISNRGVFVDIEQLGYPVCFNEMDLINEIKNYSVSDEIMNKNKSLFFDYQDNQSTKRIVEFIERL